MTGFYINHLSLSQIHDGDAYLLSVATLLTYSQSMSFGPLQKRDALSRTKQVRDSLRIDNQRMQANSGLVGNNRLLRDFEERFDQADQLTRRLNELQARHAEISMILRGNERRIRAVSATR